MDRQIRRLGIVNRGEPAVRALTAVAELNQAGDQPPIQTIVLYTDPDADSWFVREADEAVPLGTATFVDPADGTRRSRYLDEAAVVAALRGADVDTVWVGWGFVAEHASFAQACEEAGIIFVGPDSATIRRLGDKVAAKRFAEQADVPVVPWSRGPVERRSGGDEARGAARLSAAGQGGLRRRRPRDPDGRRRRRTRGGAAVGARRGGVGVRRPHGLPREARAGCPPRGGAGHRRRLRHRVGGRHPRLQPAAPPPEGPRGVGVDGARRRPRSKRFVTRPSGCAAAAGYRNAGTVEFLVDPAHRALPVHGGQHPAAGRASGDRGDHRAGPGQAAAARRAGRPADRTRSRR